MSVQRVLAPGSRRVRPGSQGRRGSAVAPLSALDVPHEVDDDLALLGIIPEIFIDFLRSFRWLNMRDNHTPARGIMGLMQPDFCKLIPEDFHEEDLEVLGELEFSARRE